MQQNSLFGAEPPPTADIHRLFFALLPDEATRERMAAVAAEVRAQHDAGGRLIGAHRYHLTLQFLGDAHQFQADRAAAAQQAAADIVAAAFDLPLDRAGSFRNRSIPWWLGCERTPEGLQTLFDRLGVALAKRGVRVEGGHSLTPHVTIVRDAAAPLHPPIAIGPIAWRVSDFALIHSQLGSRNAYTVLGQWPLAD
ncbi:MULTISPECIES: RNA 2',3'-cyclic phosphodiesterase [Lysobacter]|uniref:RNA 2',3'-cyclic phosphodiesterase n=1 Tax=Lysobacter TaxID=68 RepID=UPI001F3445BE|nr:MULTISPECIES: RNA 2',3'-cyclic phosphodiesterase [Lysobacter]UJB20966.1 RNA 2',3'-cyclic phosphodiesterase [Lysobacter capsici]UJQ29919.1 RNA 2',3'-cyclic phosphodiesterase [Lysobacter gummosus]